MTELFNEFHSQLNEFTIELAHYSLTGGECSKVCEGGESREAFACKLNFGPPQFLFEINDHVTQTHFWSTFKLIENSVLVQFEPMKVDQK